MYRKIKFKERKNKSGTKALSRLLSVVLSLSMVSALFVMPQFTQKADAATATGWDSTDPDNDEENNFLLNVSNYSPGERYGMDDYLEKNNTYYAEFVNAYSGTGGSKGLIFSEDYNRELYAGFSIEPSYVGRKLYTGRQSRSYADNALGYSDSNVRWNTGYEWINYELTSCDNVEFVIRDLVHYKGRLVNPREGTISKTKDCLFMGDITYNGFNSYKNTHSINFPVNARVTSGADVIEFGTEGTGTDRKGYIKGLKGGACTIEWDVYALVIDNTVNGVDYFKAEKIGEDSMTLYVRYRSTISTTDQSFSLGNGAQVHYYYPTGSWDHSEGLHLRASFNRVVTHGGLGAGINHSENFVADMCLDGENIKYLGEIGYYATGGQVCSYYPSGSGTLNAQPYWPTADYLTLRPTAQGSDEITVFTPSTRQWAPAYSTFKVNVEKDNQSNWDISHLDNKAEFKTGNRGGADWKVAVKYGYLDKTDDSHYTYYYYDTDVADGLADLYIYASIHDSDNDDKWRDSDGFLHNWLSIARCSGRYSLEKTVKDIGGGENAALNRAIDVDTYTNGVYKEFYVKWKDYPFWGFQKTYNGSSSMYITFEKITDQPFRDPELTASDMSVLYGSAKSIGATIVNQNGSNANTLQEAYENASPITYESLDTSIVKVNSEGKVTGMGIGTAGIKITVPAWRSYAARTKTIYVNVTANTQNITVDSTASVDYKGTKMVTVSNNSSNQMTVESLDPDVVTASLVMEDSTQYVKLEGKYPGTAKVFIESPEGNGFYSAQKVLTVTVNKIKPTFTTKNVSVAYDEGAETGVSVTGNGILTYESVASNGETGFTVDASGYVRGTKVGTWTLKVNAAESEYYLADSTTLTVTVNKADPTFTKAENIDVMETDTAQVEAEVNSGGVFTYSIKDKSIATVSREGIVTGVKAGSTTMTITAAATDSYVQGSTTITINVTPFEAGDQIATITATDQTMNYGETVKQTVTVDSGGALTFTVSEGSDIIKMTTDGGTITFTAKKPGEAKVTINASGTKEYAPATRDIIITVLGLDPTITASDINMTYGGTTTFSASTNSSGTMTYENISQDIISLEKVNGVYQIKALAAGEGAINVNVAADSGFLAATKTVYVHVAKADPAITIKNSKVTYLDSINLGALVTSGGNLTYSLADTASESKLEINALGLITGLAAGTAKVHIDAEETGNYNAASKDFTITVSKAAPTVTATVPAVMETDTQAVEASSNSGGALTYVVKDKTIATADRSGNITGVKAGKTTLTVKTAATDNYTEGSTTIDLTVVPFEPGPNIPTITASDIELGYGKSGSLNASVDSKSALTFISSNPSVAKVDANGNVTAISVGTATVTITSAPTILYQKGEKTVSVKVSGTDPVITASDMTVAYDGTVTLKASADSAGAITFENLSENLIELDAKGNIKGIEVGTAYVNVHAAAIGGFNAGDKLVAIEVVQAKPTITVKNTKTVFDGSAELKAEANSGGIMSYTSSNTDVVTVDGDGNIKGTGASVNGGKATVTIEVGETTHYLAGSLDVEVTVEKAQPEIEAGDVTLTFGTEKGIGAHVVSNGAMSYTSSDENVATVNSDGIVTGVHVGTAKITINSAATDNYKTASTEIGVTVTKAKPVITTSASYSGNVNGDTFNLDATTGILGMNMVYTSEDEEIATVDEDGNVQMLKEDTTYIVITAPGTDDYEEPEPKRVPVTGNATAPGAPANFSATSGEDSQVTLTWAAPTNNGGRVITAYRVMRSEDGGNSFEAIADNLNANVFEYVDTDVENGKTYTYQIIAKNTDYGQGTTPIAARPYRVPEAPLDFTALATSQYSIVLSWNAPDIYDKIANGGDPVSDYKVKVYSDEEMTDDITDKVQFGTRVQDDEDVYILPVMGLSIGTDYYFTVEALNAASETASEEDIASATALAHEDTWNYPSVPQNLRIDPLSRGTIDVIWDYPEDDGDTPVINYTLSYRRVLDSQWIVIRDIEGDENGAIYRLENLDADYMYQFRVAAFNYVGTSGYCDTIETKVIRRPEIPELVSVDSANGGVYITANNVKDNGSYVASYAVYYKLHNSDAELKKLCELEALKENIYKSYAEGLDNGITYDIAVAAINEAGESDLTETISVIPGSPTAVKNLEITPQPGQIMTISFDPSDGQGADITGYDIYVGGTIEGYRQEFEKVATITGTSYDYDATERINGDTIIAYVVAKNDYSSTKSDEVYSGIGTPDAPVMTDYYTDDNGIHASWTAAKPNGFVVTDYTVHITGEGEDRQDFNFENDATYTGYISNERYEEQTGSPMEAGKKYEIKVSATNASGRSVYSNTGTFVYAAPSKPENVTGTGGDNYLTVNWLKPSSIGGGEITGYYIYMNEDNDPTLHVTWEEESNGYQLYTEDYRNGEPAAKYGSRQSDLDSFAVAVSDLANGAAYTARVSAENKYGEGPLSDVSNSDTPNGLSGTPKNVSATALSGTEVEVTWRKPLNNGGSAVLEYVVTAYEVARKNYKTGEYEAINEVVAGTTTSTTQSAKMTGLSSGSEYEFTVSAVTKAGQGAESERSNAARTFTKPSQPVITSLVSGMGPQENLPLTVKWQAPEDDGQSAVIGYDVYVNGTMKMNLEEGMLASDTRQYVMDDVRIKTGKTYDVTVVAYNDITGTEQGVASEKASITMGTIAPPDDIVIIPDRSGTVDISWSDDKYEDIIEYIDKYAIYVNGKVADTVTTNEAHLSGYKIGDKLKIEISVLSTFGSEGAKSEEQTVTIGSSTKINSVTATADYESAVVAWSAVDANVSTDFRPLYYNIYVNGSVYETIPVSGLTGLERTITNLEGGKEYEIAVSAINQYGEGLLSDTVAVTPWSDPDVVRISNIEPGVGSFSFTFEDGDGNGAIITDHQVFLDGRQINDQRIVRNTITISGVSDGTEHEFYVTAVNDKGCISAPPTSPYSVITGVPTAPEYINAIAGNESITLVFSKSPDVSSSRPVTRYVIYQNGSPITSVASATPTINDKYYINIDNLHNGELYYYSVLPYNANGPGDYSDSIYIVPGTPQTPVISEVTPYSHELDITWTEPDSNIGKITKYIVYVNGEEVLNTPRTNARVTGLDNGEEYTIQISAYNHIGEGGKSIPVTSIPIGVSDEVTNVSYERNYYENDCGITLTWDAPDEDGGLEITGYKVVGDGNIEIESTAEGGKAEITELSRGTEYKYDIIPVNSAGDGKAYTVEVVTMDIPNAPEIIGATSYNNSIFTTWKAPQYDGGMDILNYVIYAVPLNGGDTVTWTGLPTPDKNGELKATIASGLRINESYTVTVSAVNVVGESEQSRSIRLPVRDVLVSKIPSEPIGLTAAVKDSTVTLSWKAPLDDGNSTITSYQVWGGNSAENMEVIATVDGYTFSYVDTNLRNGIERFYKVKAVNAVSVDGGPFSETISAIPVKIAAPSKPQWPGFDNENGISAYKVNAQQTRMTITWEASTGDERGGAITYNVYVNGELVDNVANTSYIITPLSESTRYNIQIRAINEIGGETASEYIRAYKNLNIVKGNESDGFTYDRYYADGVFANIDENYDGDEDYTPTYSVPSTPENVSVTKRSGEAVLTWNTPSSDGNLPIQGYHIYKNGEQIDIPVRSDETYEYSFDIEYGNLYVVYVKAYNEFGEGQSSNPIFINPDMDTPSDMTATIIEEDEYSRDIDIKLEWTMPENNDATAYVLYVNGSPTIINVNDASLTVDGTTVSYVYTAEVGNEYNFAVSAKYDDAETNLTDAATADTRESVPKPQNVSITKDQLLAWEINYDENDVEIDHFIIYVNGEQEDYEVYGEERSTVLSLDDSALVKLAAVSKRGTVGETSKPVKYNIDDAKEYGVDTPSSPTNIRSEIHQTNGVLNAGEDNVTITWETGEITDTHTVAADSFNIYFGRNKVATVSENSYSFEAQPDKDYDVTIEPVTGGKAGPGGSVVVSVPKNTYAGPGKPTFSAELNSAKTKVILRWNEDANLDYNLIVNGDEEHKIPVAGGTVGYVYNLSDQSMVYTFRLEAIKTYSDGNQGVSLSDIVTVNPSAADEIDDTYISNKPVITGSISNGAKVKVFWDAPEAKEDEHGEITEYRIAIDGAEQSDSIKADENFVYTVEFSNLTSTKIVEIRAYKEVNGNFFCSSASDSWIISPLFNQASLSDFANDNKNAEVANKDSDGDGVIDNDSEVRIPVSSVNASGFKAELLDEFNNSIEAEIETSDDQIILFFTLDDSVDEDTVFTLKISKDAYTSYKMTNIPYSELSKVSVEDVLIYAGDLNGDGRINSNDTSALRKNSGRRFTDSSGLAYGDFNEDGIIDNDDTKILNANMGQKSITVTFGN